MDFSNAYDDDQRAEAYAKLEFPGTYYLAYRDLPEIIREHVNGKRALDFGCGTGRSTRFLKKLGFEATGVDIAEGMLKKARERDPRGDYRLIADGDLGHLQYDSYDLVLSVFTFDNIPTMAKKIKLFSDFGRLLKRDGKVVNVVSSPDIYTHEWASFTTKSFPENHHAKTGDKVKIVITDVDDKRPVEDVIWMDEDYQQVFRRAGLELVETYKPLAEESEPYHWVNETSIAPWVIYVLKKATSGRFHHGDQTCRTNGRIEGF
ncbi:MAG: methyltransferase domain-containing protein [Candidatus Latescibacteria bacterium]|nr:methyltransferase domain-containing protein [Candidatus Latescibacterota bacterium]NIM66536.1 methyltransferase domain-containing protein [Candidatus Latescibacterota bacterium]NIO03017.1 methyltransferase domain-containing protein [Candidatus Latescibacterota bacterium]NIO30153.1 methyltransferase domain-containing protein [Candidatus Latescibacterota bacterium]NIO57770.1 methyltransferase domain-containing protein [Candidatus Latescibacterota bacterium]